jgi:hypothetical protein
MSATRTRWLPAAQSVGWFRLDRHEDPDPADPEPAPDPAADPADPDPDPEPDPAADPPDPDPEDDPEGADELGEGGKRALAAMKAEKAAAKKEAAAAKKQATEERRKAAELARKVAEFEDRDKSELEKAQAKAERSEKQATEAVARSVRSEIKVAASGTFADAADAIDVLMRDPSKYVDSDGEIDTAAIESDLTDLLERKPHWAKPEPAAPVVEPKQKLKPDPGQGSRGAPAPVDYRTAPKSDVATELAKYGYRQRV